MNCKSLEYIDIPKNVSIIGNNAFKNCHTIRTITLPKNESFFLGINAFTQCINLESVIIHSDIRRLDKTFDGCKKLVNITLPSTITSLGPYTFRNCKNLETITLPDSIQKCDESIFDGCIRLKNETLLKNITSVPI